MRPIETLPLITHDIGVQNFADVDVTLQDVGKKYQGSAGFIMGTSAGTTLSRNGHTRRRR